MANTIKSIFEQIGGATKVARLLDAPVTTVWAWQRAGRIPPSRLAHLRLAAKANGLEVPALAAMGGDLDQGRAKKRKAATA
ncbi:hypothetical protein TomTYG75_06910 [Sphingobium sp. TomTYG75]